MIDAITLESVDNRYAPPEQVLHVAVVGDVAFLTIYDYSETNTEITMKKRDNFQVSLKAMQDALAVLSAADRSAYTVPNPGDDAGPIREPEQTQPDG